MPFYAPISRQEQIRIRLKSPIHRERTPTPQLLIILDYTVIAFHSVVSFSVFWVFSDRLNALCYDALTGDQNEVAVFNTTLHQILEL
jgi:hypothetical protein